MNLDQIAAQLRSQADAIYAMVVGVSAEQARWQPAADSWSLLEVINHLDDEERLDFRVRLDLLLHQPHEPWPPTDPQGWVVSRAYNQRDLQTSLERFHGSARRLNSLAGDAGGSELGSQLPFRPGAARFALAICWPPGSPTICCTSASWSNCIGAWDERQFRALPLGVCRRLVAGHRRWG